MALARARIEQLERELEEAKAQLAKEDGERFRVIWREISDEEKSRILGGLTDRKERALFGLEFRKSRKGDLGPVPGQAGAT